jgi:limonene 1,2-monooxygenase
MSNSRLRFGVFVAPFHPLEENPGLAMERDLELMEWIDKIGFEEAWIGEHHSGGWEINASPELFIAAAAQRTKYIRFGTGVSSVPYHHPYILADRIRQLDYLTRGRAMLGLGPGSLPSDAYMMGIETPQVRDILDAAIDPIVRLMRGETVTTKNDWFTLQEARLQLLSYKAEGVEIAVANQVSPTGSRAAGRHGLSLLSIGATSTGGFNALGSNWAIAEESAREFGNTMDRSAWRLVGPYHVAETAELARAQVREKIVKFVDYFKNVAAIPLAFDGNDPIQVFIDSGFAVIGTPDDCVAQVERLQQQSGGFGCFLNMAHNWAEFDDTKRSYELVARFVVPKVNKINANRAGAESWLRANRGKFVGQLQAAVGARLSQYAKEKGTANIAPGLMDIFSADAKK